MKATVLAGSMLSCLVLAAPLAAQEVEATVRVRSGPVTAHVNDHGYSTYRRPEGEQRHPSARRVGVERYQPRVIVVDRVRARRSREYWAHHGYRPVTLYYVDGRYYDRRIGGREVREVVVYERDGRYFDGCDDARSHR